MITFVCWKWKGPDPQRAFHSGHVNWLRAAIARHYRKPHRFVCITDDAHGLAPGVEPVAMPATRWDTLEPGRRFGKVRTNRRRVVVSQRQFPACYRRLWNFSREAAAVLGPRIVAIDIDVVICGDLEPLLAVEGDFVGWCDPMFRWQKIAGGVYMLRTGSHPEVWEEFEGEASIVKAHSHGLSGSDQAWMSLRLFPPMASWSSADGVVKLGWVREGGWQTPPGIRMAFTSGHTPPWHPDTQRRYPWICDHLKS